MWRSPPPDLQQTPSIPQQANPNSRGYSPPLNVGQDGTKQSTGQPWRSDGNRNRDWLNDPHICQKSVGEFKSSVTRTHKNTNIKSKCSVCLSGALPLKNIHSKGHNDMKRYPVDGKYWLTSIHLIHLGWTIKKEKEKKKKPFELTPTSRTKINNRDSGWFSAALCAKGTLLSLYRQLLWSPRWNGSPKVTKADRQDVKVTVSQPRDNLKWHSASFGKQEQWPTGSLTD